MSTMTACTTIAEAEHLDEDDEAQGYYVADGVHQRVKNDVRVHMSDVHQHDPDQNYYK